MSFLDTLRKNLTPELFTQVTDQLGDDFDFDLVPRSRLNKVIKQRNDLRNQIAEGSQPQNTKPQGHEDDDDFDDGTGTGGDAGKGAGQVDIEKLQKQWKAQQDKAVQDVKIQYAALEKLRAANAIDAEVLWNAGVIDKSKLALDATGALTGLDDIITQLQKDKAHLFKSGTDGVPSGTGKDGGDGFKGVTDRAAFLKLPADQQIAFKAANPTLFQQFMTAE
jgi:hypothetical protein